MLPVTAQFGVSRALNWLTSMAAVVVGSLPNAFPLRRTDSPTDADHAAE